MHSDGFLAHESKIYSSFSSLYDRIFTNLFFPRINHVMKSMDLEPGSRILEVGVGTGLALPAYPEHCRVTGVDLSEGMLACARDKATARAWSHVDLSVADALKLPFASNSFDCVSSFHVVSVVPDAARMMREMVRVCRPGGTLVIINHFRSPRPLLAAAVDRLDPLTRKLGWRTTLRAEELLGVAELNRVRRFKLSPPSLFTVVMARNPERPARAA